MERENKRHFRGEAQSQLVSNDSTLGNGRQIPSKPKNSRKDKNQSTETLQSQNQLPEETDLKYKNIYWSLFDGTLQRSWKYTEHGSPNYYDFLKEYSVSFYLFYARAIGLTSERFEKSTTVLVLIILILGFVGNIVTICTVLCFKKYHTPTFVAIGCLAFFDMLNIISATLDTFSTLVTYLEIQHLVFDRAFGSMIAYFLCDILLSCSCSQIVFLYMIRYLLTVHPLQSKIRLTPSIVLACSVMIFIFLSLFSAFRLIIITTVIKDLLHLYKIIRLISGTFLLYTYYLALLLAFLNFSMNPYILFFASLIV
ncbi:trace amine-associated receptor 1-like [Saccostrea cucullata]|uniref:trace amine-associated receptor 1-like n=1 Tax=Saccostrea cuccullata TaxID=36930 RepID=UPI002ED4764E